MRKTRLWPRAHRHFLPTKTAAVHLKEHDVFSFKTCLFVETKVGSHLPCHHTQVSFRFPLKLQTDNWQPNSQTAQTRERAQQYNSSQLKGGNGWHLQCVRTGPAAFWWGESEKTIRSSAGWSWRTRANWKQMHSTLYTKPWFELRDAEKLIFDFHLPRCYLFYYNRKHISEMFGSNKSSQTHMFLIYTVTMLILNMAKPVEYFVFLYIFGHLYQNCIFNTINETVYILRGHKVTGEMQKHYCTCRYTHSYSFRSIRSRFIPSTTCRRWRNDCLLFAERMKLREILHNNPYFQGSQ